MSFQYTAFTASGKKTSGTVACSDRAQALQFLKVKGLKPIEIIEKKEEEPVVKAKRLKAHKGLALSFLKQLEQLHSGGMPIGDAIRILQQRLHDPAQKELAQSTWRDLSEGLTLSQAFRKFPNVFDEAILSPLEAGEATGQIGPILRDIIDQLTAQLALRKKIIAGLSYPIFICFVAFGVIGIFLFFLLPKIQSMMTSLGGEMALSARLLLGGANLLIRTGPFMLIAGVIALVVFLKWRKTAAGRYASDKWALKVPLLKNMIVFSEICKTSNLMATLLGSGVNATQSMRLTEKAIQNVILQERFRAARQKINDGLSFSKAFEKFSFFPDLAIDILTVGDSTGNMVHSFREIYKIFSEKLVDLLQFLTTLISSLALGFAFGLVTLLALSIVGSVLQLSNSLLAR
ncbi:MAG: hypothetical protein A2Y14_00960 [Verrucomicrobia bacterium GWF2_51_19]|nr:MAG: hypothetical protein A2Y14_00960 [Verrucomicrobia bacterium GWF2_51_19]HCJ12005.1 hypothetical protein [Opitutae bacterium]